MFAWRGCTQYSMVGYGSDQPGVSPLTLNHDTCVLALDTVNHTEHFLPLPPPPPPPLTRLKSAGTKACIVLFPIL
jgi:hypothetical protein